MNTETKLVPIEPSIHERRCLEGKTGVEWIEGYKAMIASWPDAAAPQSEQPLRRVGQRRQQLQLLGTHARRTYCTDRRASAPVGENQIKKPRLFYYEESENCWCPADKLSVDNIISTDSFISDGEIIEIQFKRVDMTDEELENSGSQTDNPAPAAALNNAASQPEDIGEGTLGTDISTPVPAAPKPAPSKLPLNAEDVKAWRKTLPDGQFLCDQALAAIELEKQHKSDVETLAKLINELEHRIAEKDKEIARAADFLNATIFKMVEREDYNRMKGRAEQAERENTSLKADAWKVLEANTAYKRTAERELAELRRAYKAVTGLDAPKGQQP